MPTRLTDKLTPVSINDMAEAMGLAWLEFCQERPGDGVIELLGAHWGFETGYGRGMHNYNVGNFKSVEGDGRDYAFFYCTELFPEARAQVVLMDASKNGWRVEVRGQASNGQLVLGFWPDHPTCRFRAFATVTAGVRDYLEGLAHHFSDPLPEKDAWKWLRAADPVRFCHALKLKGYYTDDEKHYTSQVVAIFNARTKAGKFDLDRLPLLSERQQVQLANVQLASLMDLAREVVEPSSPPDPDDFSDS